MNLYNVAQFLGGLSLVGGATATAFAATGHSVASPVMFAGLNPQEAAEWIPVIANAIPAIGGAVVLLCGRIRQARRKAGADDNQTAAQNWKTLFEETQAKLNAVTAERDELKAKLQSEVECE